MIADTTATVDGGVRSQRQGERWMSFALLLGLLFVAAAEAQDPKPAASAREMLRIMQIDESQLGFFLDDRDVVAEERETLHQLLFRMPRFSLADLGRWSQAAADWDLVRSNPDSCRFEMFQIRGEITDLQVVEVLPELARRLMFREYFRVMVQHERHRFLIYTREIPGRWRDAISREEPIHEAIQVQGMLLKRLDLHDGPLVFAAARIGWHPTQVNSQLGVTEDKVLLAQLGFDISRLDEMEQRTGMRSGDRECFYQAMAAVRDATPRQLARLGRRSFDIARLIKTPQAAAGDLYTLEGVARRIVKIQVPDVDIRSRFGLSHYYEMEVFLPLERQVRFQDEGEEEGKVFREYPFVFCVPQLPQGLEEGDDIRAPVQVSGFFLKLWAYRTEFMSGDQPRTERPRLQLSPLLVGPGVVPRGAAPIDPSSLTMTFACIFTVGLAVIWILLWQASRKDRQQAKRLFRKHQPPESLDTLQE